MHSIVAQSGPCDIVASMRGVSLFNFVDFPHPSKSVFWLPRHLLINPSVCELRASRARRAPARQLAHGPTSWDLSPQKN